MPTRAVLDPQCLDILTEHRASGALPTSVRFVFYELVGRGIIPKSLPGKRQPSQYVSEALTRLREAGEVPWAWIVDETRALTTWEHAPSVYAYVKDAVSYARVDCWAGDPVPLVLVESRSLAGVLRNMLGEYLVPVASTNGQVGGFLHTDIAPALDADQRVIYLGDHDHQGHQIEANTRRVLQQAAPLRWERLALTDVQVGEHALPSVVKLDRRYRPSRAHEAWETEALSQAVIVGLVRSRLDELLPEPLADVRVREQRQRDQLAEILDRLDEPS